MRTIFFLGGGGGGGGGGAGGVYTQRPNIPVFVTSHSAVKNVL